MEGVEIVEAGTERLEEIEPLWTALSEHHAELTPTELPIRPAAEGWPIRREIYREGLEDGAVLVFAERAGRPIGFAFAHPQKAPTNVAIDRVVDVETVAVLPEARGKGVGGALMDAVDDWADAHGFELLQVSVRNANEGARRLYERRGFIGLYTTMVARRPVGLPSNEASPSLVGAMFAPSDRERLREVLVERAREDDRVVSAALLGSSATGEEDRFSDIDLALSIADADVETATEDWTRFMHEEAGAVHHLDVRVGAIIYRVFLLRDSLQVDLSFWPASEFTATGPRFHLLFGDPPTERHRQPPSPEALVGEAWLYLIHARSSLGRDRPWQASHMLGETRDRILELACLRHGLRPDEARGVDDLPPTLLDRYEPLVPASLAGADLAAAIGTASSALLEAAALVSSDLAERIARPVAIIGRL